MAFINNVGPAGPTEGELYRYLVDLTRKAEETCRQMAHKRGDTRWLELGRVAFGEKCRGGNRQA